MITSSALACNGNGNTNEPTSTEPPQTTLPVQDVVFTIGNLTDQTGVASSAVTIIDTTLEDMVSYYNDENLIPGVKLKVESYDTQYDPALAKSGFERLKSKGADIIWTPVTSVVPVLKPVVDNEHIPLFAASANLGVVEG